MALTQPPASAGKPKQYPTQLGLRRYFPQEFVRARTARLAWGPPLKGLCSRAQPGTAARQKTLWPTPGVGEKGLENKDRAGRAGGPGAGPSLTSTPLLQLHLARVNPASPPPTCACWLINRPLDRGSWRRARCLGPHADSSESLSLHHPLSLHSVPISFPGYLSVGFSDALHITSLSCRHQAPILASRS